MRRSLVPLALLGILLLVPSPAAATDAHLTLTSGVPIKFAGALDAALVDATLVAAGNAGHPQLALAFGSAHLRTLRVTSAYQVLPTGAPLLVDRTQSESVESLEAGGADLVGRAPTFLLVSESPDARFASPGAPPSDPDRVWTDASSQLGLLLSDRVLAPANLPSPLGLPVADAPRTVPASRFELKSPGADIEQGPTRITWYEGALEVRTTRGARVVESATTQADAPGSVWVPPALPGAPGTWTGPGTHREETLVYHVLAPTSSRLEWTADGAATSLYAGRARLTFDGYIGFPWAVGQVRVGTEPRNLPGHQAIAGGRFTLDALASRPQPAPGISLDGTGDVTFLRIGVETETFPAAAAAAAGAGAAVAAAGVAATIYYWPALKWSLSALWAPLYARLPKDRVLEHTARDTIYQRVLQEPGISTNKLARDFPYGWSTLTYHLRVLERNEAIVSVRHGRYKRFFDRASGKYANGRKWVVAVLKNEATLAIGRLILAHPGITQKEVGEGVGLAPSSVHWHVERLEDARLSERRRDGHNVRYYPGPAWKEVDPLDLGVPAAASSTNASPAPRPPSLVPFRLNP